MAENYQKGLVGLQLQKQIEQKKKETIKKKSDAETRLQAAQQLREHCKRMNAEVASVEKAIGLVVAALDSKDFDLAVEQSDKAVELAKKTFSDRLDSIFTSAEEIVKIVTEIGEEPQQLKKLISDAKEALEMGDYDSAVKLAEQTYDNSQKALHEQYAKIYSRAQQITLKAKEFGENVESLQKDLQNTKEMIENEDYTTAITTVKTTLEAASDLLKTKVVSDIDSIEDGVLSAEDLGTDASKLKEYISKARELVNSMDFDEAMSYARRAQSEAEKSIAGKIHEETRKLREDARTTKKHGGEVDNVLSLVDVAAKQIKDHDIGEASRNLEKARGSLKEVQFKVVLASISKSKDNFILAKKLGVDISRAVTMLNDSRDKLQKGQFEEAIEAAVTAEQEIENSLTAFRHAQEKVEDLSAKVKSVMDLGIALPEDYTYFEDAKEALSDRDFVLASENATTGLDQLDKFLKKTVQDMILEAEVAVAAAENLDADVADAKDLLESAKENLTELNLMQAYREAKECIELANAACKEDIGETVSDLEDFIDECSKSFDVVDYITGLETVKSLVASSRFAEAMAKIADIKKGLGNKGSEETRKLLGDSEMSLNELETAGIDAADLRLMLTKANEFFSQGMLDKAVATAKEMMKDANSALSDLSRKTLISLKTSIENAQSENLDITKWKALYKQSKESYESGEFFGSYQTSKKIIDEMGRMMKERQAVMSRIKRAEELLADAAKNRLDVSAPTRMIEAAKAEISRGDAKRVAVMVEEAERAIEGSMGMFLTAKMIMLLKSSLEFADNEGIEAGNAPRLLEDAKAQMKERKYDVALTSTKRAQAELSRIFKTTAAAGIAEVKGLISDAKNVGADIARPEKLLESAQLELESNDFEAGLKSVLMAKSEIRQIKDLSSKSTTEIKIAKERIRDAEAIGLDMSEPRALLLQAMEALADNKYAISYEFSRKISTFSTEVVKNNLDELFEGLSDRVEAIERNGVNAERARSLLNEAKKAYKAGSYQEVIGFIMQCEQDIDRSNLQMAIAANSLQVATKRVGDAEKELLVVSKAKKMLEEAQNAMKRKRFSDVIVIAIAVGDEVERAWHLMDDCRREVNALDERIAKVNRVGIDVSSMDKLKKEAERALQNAEYTSCREICRGAEKRISDELESIISDKVERANALIQTGQQLGFEDGECGGLVAVAQTSAKEGLWDFAYEQVDKCCKRIETGISEKMQAAMSNMLAKMSALQKAGASVKSIEDDLKTIEAKMADMDYSEAYRMLMDAEAKLTGIEMLHKDYLAVKYEADSSIVTAKKFGLPTRESEGLVEEADNVGDDDYASAIELLRKAADSAKAGMEKFNPDISISVKPVEMEGGKSATASIDITNKGKALAKDLKLGFHGNFDVETMPEIPALRPGEKKTVELTLVPRQAGEFDVEIVVAAKRLTDGKEFEFAARSTAKVLGKEPSVRIARALEPTTCSSCKGKIKPGFDIAVCLKCEAVEHLPCAKRTKKCGNCGAALEF